MRTHLCLTFVAICHLAAADVVRSIAEADAAFAKSGGDAVRFDITATITLPGIPGKRAFAAEDSSGCAVFGTNPSITSLCPTNAGDVMRLRGVLVPSRLRNHVFEFDTLQIDLVRHGPPPTPRPITGRELAADDDLKLRLVTVRGKVHDVFRDEIDPPWLFFVLDSDGVAVYFAAYSETAVIEDFDRFIGATVSATGVANDSTGARAVMKRVICAHSLSAIKILAPSTADPFDVPRISEIAAPHDITHFASTRCRAAGHVVAVWDAASSILLAADDGGLMRVDLRNLPAPPYGSHVEVAGIPETDLYRINLSRAIWRKTPGSPFHEQQAIDISAEKLVSNVLGVSAKNASLHGQTVRLRGIVRGLPAVGLERGKAYVESGQTLIPIDASVCPEAFDEVTVGSLVEVTGTLIHETENWRTNRVLPQIREVLVAIRRAEDVKVLSKPPWWTPARLLTAIGVLLVALFGVVGWSVARRRAEQLARISSELKVYERTRLAVELHDTLSQTLTGVSMGIDSALDVAAKLSPNLTQQLKYTSKAVDACRAELRNCLWDLRSQALEKADMNDAIRLALSPILSNAALKLKFNVPRERLPDNIAHTILKIIRELAANAVRHGRASSVGVAGCVDGDALKFSVSDDGCGFDPAKAPGFADGHFGLQGIGERVRRLKGSLKIESSPGNGTKVTVSLPLPISPSIA